MIRFTSTISSVAASMLLVSMLAPTSALAQERARQPQPIRQSAIAHAIKAETETRQVVKFAPPATMAAQAPSTQRKSSVGKKILGGVIGGTVGLFAGGYLGAAIEGDGCHCDDPGLQGALIGAPVGMVLGAIFGAVVVH